MVYPQVALAKLRRFPALTIRIGEKRRDAALDVYRCPSGESLVYGRIDALLPLDGAYLADGRCPDIRQNVVSAYGFVVVVVRRAAHTDRGHMARAAMEGISYSLLDCLNACMDAGAEVRHMTALGGAVNSPVWLQIQADVYNMPLRTTVSREQAVLGAAITAAVGSGAFPDFDQACARMVHFNDAVVQPCSRNHDIYMRYYDIYRRIYRHAGRELEEVTRLGRNEENEI